jgi:hypothetical protein
VAIYNCSQAESSYAAMNFKKAIKGEKRITNSAISQGNGHAIRIANSADITLDSNVIHDVREIGITNSVSSKIAINNNVISFVQPDFGHDKMYGWSKKREINGINVVLCKDFLITNNIISSAWNTALLLPGHACGA